MSRGRAWRTATGTATHHGAAAGLGGYVVIVQDGAVTSAEQVWLS